MSLAQLFQKDPSQQIFAWIGSQSKTHYDFFHDVECWRRTFERINTDKVIVYSQSTYFFACTLFAAWLNRTLTILPADITPGTLRDLSGYSSYLISDQSEIKTNLTNITSPDPCIDNALPPKIELPQQCDLVQLFTSGSTGQPILITKRLEQLFCDLGNLARDCACHLSEQSVVISSVPHQHIYGFLWRFLWPIHQGYALTDERVLYPENILQRLQSFPQCIFVSSPAVLKRLPPDLDWSEAAEHCQLVTSSGGPLFEDGFRVTIECFHKPPFEILGSTELDGIASRTRHLDANNQINPITQRWHAMPGVKIRSDENGVMAVSSIRLENLDWHTGNDIIQMYEDGSFDLKKRVDRIVKIEEKRISLDKIETLLVKTGLISECKAFLPEQSRYRGLAVIAVPSILGRAHLKQSGKNSLVKRLREALSQDFEPIAIAKWWRFEPMLPYDERGKISQKVLQETLEELLPGLEDWTIETHRAQLLAWISPTCPYFDGHFDQFSLVPGVTQVHWAVMLAHRYLNTPLSVLSVNNLKFTSPIRPNTRVMFSLTFDVEKMCLKVKLYSPDHIDIVYSCANVYFE